MQRRRHRAAVAAAAALAAVVGLTVGRGEAPAQDGGAAGPNLIVVMSDDQGPQMMGALPSVERRIGDRGATFSNAIASFPLCCPSRASLLTGQYAHNHGTTGNSPRGGGGYRALLDPERNLASWLQAGGYDTAFAGKWLNGLRAPRRAPPGWDEWHGLVGEGGDGLSSYYDFDVFEPDGSPRHFGTAARDYQTDALTREYALPFIAGHAADPDPFFLWLAYHPPHNGLGRSDAAGRRCSDGGPDSRGGHQSAIPPPRYARRYLAADVPKPPSFDEADVSDKPGFVARRPQLDPAEIERIVRDYRCGLAALRALDDSVGAILDDLRATGQLERTVLVFTADQGVFAGQHRIARGKNRPYEEALDVPLLIRGPGVVPGRVVSAPVANVDLAPTLLALAAVEVPAELARPIDGVSLAPVLGGSAPAAGRAVLIEGRNSVAPAERGFKVRSYVGVRTRRYSYVEQRRARYASQSEGAAAPIGAGRTTDVELYDLARDPYELRSRARDRAYAGARETLAAALERLEQCTGPDCQAQLAPPPPAP